MCIAKNYGARNYDAALLVAVENGHLDAMKLLRSWGAYQLEFAMHRAVQHGQLGAMQLLKSWDSERYPGVEGQGKYDDYFCLAVRNGQVEAVRLLKEWGATTFSRGLAIVKTHKHGVGPIAKQIVGMKHMLSKWRRILRESQDHATQIELVIVLAPLDLPAWVVVWLLDWAAPGPLPELKRLRLVEGVRRSLRETRSEYREEYKDALAD